VLSSYFKLSVYGINVTLMNWFIRIESEISFVSLSPLHQFSGQRFAKAWNLHNT